MILTKGLISCSNNKVFAGCNTVTELARVADIPAAYVHPSEKQCNYTYTHPSTKQCSWTPTMPITLIATYTNAEAMKPAEVELNLSSYYVYIIAGKSSGGSRLYVDGNSTTLDITPGGGDDTSGLAILARVTSTVRNQFNYIVVNGDTETSAGVGSIRGTLILTFTGPGTVKLYGVL